MKYLLFLSLFAITLTSSAQDAKKAMALLDRGAYLEAMDEYQALVTEEPENHEYHYHLAICYLNTYVDKALAVPHLEKVVSKPGFDDNATYLLGRAYHFAYMFDDAIEAYHRFKEAGKGSEFNLEDVDRQIKHCEYAKELIKFPVDVTFKNLGYGVNSPYPDYYPFVPSDESFIIFNSKRDDGSEANPDDTYSSNIYISQTREGNFAKAKLVGNQVNSELLNEEIIGLTSAGDKALLFLYDERGYGDIFITNVVDGELEKPTKLDKVINSKYVEIAGSINALGNEVYFASDRPGGYGGVDLYITRKLPNGKWGPAQNLGPGINTSSDEDFPNLSPDGKTLYFSSKGHTSMGGYDIFSASWDNEKKRFTSVRNLGYPVNTPEDNMNFRVSENGRYGYISALREGGYGDLDVYEVTFNQVEPSYTVLVGKLTAIGEGELVDPMISVQDLDTGEEYGTYLPNPRTMRFVIILPPGRYNIYADAPGFEDYSEDLEILNKNAYKAEISRDIEMKAQ